LAPQHLGWAGRDVGRASANNGGAHACASEWRSKLGNTVGSLSEVQRQVIVGSLLGDGAMRCKTNALLEINHSSHQRSYVDWKYRHLAPLVRTPPKARKTNGTRIAYRFVTRSLPELTPYFRMFYGSGRKRIPEVPLRELTLAVWFMDDGCRSRSSVYLNTQQYDMPSQLRLLRLLHDQWGIEAALNRDKAYYRVRLTVEGTRRFVGLVEPYLLPELRYKLPQMTP
jgi:LAGLIDADG DNA endonuclease family